MGESPAETELPALLRDLSSPEEVQRAAEAVEALACGAEGLSSALALASELSRKLVSALGGAAAAHAALALEILCCDSDFRLHAADCGAGEALVELISVAQAVSAGAANVATATAATGALRSLASGFSISSTAIRCRIVAAGAIQPLVRILQSPQQPGGDAASAASRGDSPSAGDSEPSTSGRPFSASEPLRLEAAGALCNLADSRSHREAIVAAGAVLALAQILCTTPPSDELAAVAASALRNLAIDTPAAMDAVAAAGGLPLLVNLLRSGPDKDLTLQVAGTLCNLADSPESRDAIADAGAVAPLVELLLTCSDLELPAVAAGALSNLALGSPENRIAILEAGGVPPLLTLLEAGPEEEVTLQALAALANLSTLCPPVRDAVRSLGGIPQILALLSSGGARSRPQLVAFAAAVTRSLLVNSAANCHACAAAGGVPLLVRLASSGAPDDEATAHAVGALFCLAQAESLAEPLRAAGLAAALVPLIARVRSEAAFVQALLALAVAYSGRFAQHPRVAAVCERLDLASHLARILRACLTLPDRVYLSVSFATADAVFFLRACSVEPAVAARLAELGVLDMLLDVVRSGVGGAVATVDATRATWQICYARCAQGTCGCAWLLELMPSLKGKVRGAASKRTGGGARAKGLAAVEKTTSPPDGSAAGLSSPGSSPNSPLSPVSTLGELSPTSVAASCASAAAIDELLRQDGDLLGSRRRAGGVASQGVGDDR